jgi:LmbE family N-acetylglucosaminyl deacetylase
MKVIASALFIFLLQSSGQFKTKLQESSVRHTLLAIYAHPDDELLTGAVLAHYAKAGVTVQVVIATDGSLGTTDFAKIPAGEQLAKVRRAEMICSAQALGIEPPIFLGLEDQMKTATGGLQQQIDTLAVAVTALLTKLRPDVVITFGPEGWTGHPDHRMVGTVVTDVFASRQWPGDPQLFFSALPTGSITETSWAKYRTVDQKYLTVGIPLDEDDYAKMRTAFSCHQSQYRESVRRKLPVFIQQTQNRVAMFRPFAPEKSGSTSLFKNE